MTDHLTDEELGFELLKQYKSPSTEMSLAKGIPMTIQNERALKALRRIMPVRFRYRGPRNQKDPKQRQLYCLKKNATTVAIYPK